MKQITLMYLKLWSEYWKYMIISINTRILVSQRHTELTPHRHEHRKEYCAIVIEQQAHLLADRTSSEHKQTRKHLAVDLTCTHVPWHMCRCRRAATLCISCHKVDTWLCQPHKPPFYKHSKHLIQYSVNVLLRQRYCGVVEKRTWGVSCWRRQGHKGRLWPRWEQGGWGDMCTSPTTGSTRPPFPQSSSWYKNTQTHITYHTDHHRKITDICNS